MAAQPQKPLKQPPRPRQRRSSWLAGLDMYRKVPVDLLEGSKEGNVVSWIALFAIAALILIETRQFLSYRLVTDLSLDTSSSTSSSMPKTVTKHATDGKELFMQRYNSGRVKVNFNMTMMDLKCKVSNWLLARAGSRPSEALLSNAPHRSLSPWNFFSTTLEILQRCIAPHCAQ